MTHRFAQKSPLGNILHDRPIWLWLAALAKPAIAAITIAHIGEKKGFAGTRLLVKIRAGVVFAERNRVFLFFWSSPRSGCVSRVLELIMEASFSLIHFPMFVATWVTFFAPAIISFVVQIKLSSSNISLPAFIKHCFPFGPWSKKSARIDVFMYFASKITDKLYVSATLVAMIFISVLVRNALEFVFPNHVALPFGYVTIVACSIFVFLVGDFANYLSHYLQHFVPALWELHKVHHSATFLNPLTTARMHPLGNAFDGIFSATLVGIPAGIFGFLFGFRIPDVLVLGANANLIGTIIVLDVLRHSHFPVSFGALDRIILSPHMHQLHHSSRLEHWDKNFGNKLSIWDRCFGTVVKPSKDEEFIYGLGSEENHDYDKLTGIYFGPILKIWRLVFGKSTEGVLWRKPPEAGSVAATYSSDETHLSTGFSPRQ